MVGAAAIIGGSALVGGAVQAEGARSAGNTAANAARQAGESGSLRLQLDANDAIKLLDPHIRAGREASNQLVPFAAGRGGDLPLSPDEQFILDESLNDVTRSFVAGGKSLSGQRAKALRDTAAGVRMNLGDRRFNRLLNLSNQGVTVATNQANARLGAGSQAANLLTQTGIAAGNSLAAGQLGRANAIGGAISGAGDTIGTLMALKAMKG
ncbi:MAG: hypothetical protein ACPGSM_18620 [Thiolinea sp.]